MCRTSHSQGTQAVSQSSGNGDHCAKSLHRAEAWLQLSSKTFKQAKSFNQSIPHSTQLFTGIHLKNTYSICFSEACITSGRLHLKGSCNTLLNIAKKHGRSVVQTPVNTSALCATGNLQFGFKVQLESACSLFNKTCQQVGTDCVRGRTITGWCVEAAGWPHNPTATPVAGRGTLA